MIAAPTPGTEYRDPKTRERLVVGEVREDENEIMFARFGHYGPKIERASLTDFFERYMRPNFPDDDERIDR
jgi:hypothetical protein